MADTFPPNILYLAVLPMIHLGDGAAEQVLTLYPDKRFASEFFPEEVDTYIAMFMRRTKYFIGGRVVGYDCHKELTSDGRVVVRVVQNVG